MADKRITELTNEKLILGDGDYTIVDSNEGTYKYELKRIVDSIPEPDTTLSIAGRAADAAKTGQEIADVKRDLNDSDLVLIGRENLLNSTTWTPRKYIKGDGTIGDNDSYKLSSSITVTANQTITFLCNHESGYTRLAAYDASDNPLSLLVNVGGAGPELIRQTVTTPANTAYVRCSGGNTTDLIGIILGISIDDEIIAIKNTVIPKNNILLSCGRPIAFSTSAGTLTFPRYTYVNLDGTRYDFESADVILDYSAIPGNMVSVIFDNGQLAVRSYNNVIGKTVLFTFTKSGLAKPETNNIFYPYTVDGHLYNNVETNRRLSAYVSASTGSDSNDGTATNPYKTIQKAIDQNPYIVYVDRNNGTSYSETITINAKTDMQIIPLGTPAFSTSQFDVPMVTVNRVICTGCSNILFRDIYANNPGTGNSAWYISNSDDITFMHCWASDADAGGFVTANLEGKFILCKAWNIGSETYYNSDGFNLHGYGTTEFIDCIAHDCWDDGISHHDGCIASIKGGEYWNCTHGGGIAPVNRYVEIDGAYCHDNAWGIQATQGDPTLYDPYILIKNSVLKENQNFDLDIGDITCKMLRTTYDAKRIGTNADYTEIN